MLDAALLGLRFYRLSTFGSHLI